MKSILPFKTMPEFRIPEFNKAKRGFEKLLSTDVSQYNQEQILTLLFDTFGAIHRPIYLNEWETCKQVVTRRVISDEDVKRLNLDVSDPKSFSFPENPGLGRANLPGLPVLYTADNEHTAIYEKIATAPQEYLGKDFYISEWKLRPGTSMNTIMLLFGIIDQEHFYYEIAKSNFERLSRTMKIYSRSNRKTLEYIVRSLGLIFKQESYFISSALANDWMNTGRNDKFARVDCLLYPSVRKDKSGINYAFHPEFVKNNMYISSIRKMQLDGFRIEGLNFSLKQLGVIDGSSILWHNTSFTFKRVDFLDKDRKSVKIFNQEALYNSKFHIDDQEPFHLPDKLIPILQERIQIDMCSTLENRTANPKPYLVNFENELEFDGVKVIGMECYIEYLYEQTIDKHEKV